jgi:phosphoribosylformylglycinamidine synthase
MWVVKVGGPAYRIGLGGGAASSRVGDAGTANLDFDAVQVHMTTVCYTIQ